MQMPSSPPDQQGNPAKVQYTPTTTDKIKTVVLSTIGIVGLGIWLSGIGSGKTTSGPGAGASKGPDYYKVDTVVTVTTMFYACENVAALDKIRSLLRAKDGVAAARLASDENCDPFRQGIEATVEDDSVWHAAMCLRPHGETTCRWFPAMLVKGPDDRKI